MPKRRMSTEFNIQEVLRYYLIKPSLFFNVLQHLKVNKELFIGSETCNTIVIKDINIDSVKRCLDLIKCYYFKIDYVFCPVDNKTFYIYVIKDELV